MMISSTPTNNAASVIRVKAIDHVTIVVDDLSRSRDFYRDLLGMVEVDRPDFGFPGYWLQAGATQVHLIETMEGSSEPGGGLDPDQSWHTKSFSQRVCGFKAGRESVPMDACNSGSTIPTGIVSRFLIAPAILQSRGSRDER